MTKRHFIALADLLRIELAHNTHLCGIEDFRKDAIIGMMADFCQSQNYNFNRERWLGYIAGTCGPNGGAV